MSQFPESEKMLKLAEPFFEYAGNLESLFPHLEWDLKKSGYTLNNLQYLSITLYIVLSTFVGSILVLVVPILLFRQITESYFGILVSIVVTVLTLFYMIYLPKSKINARKVLIDADLEYMLKDMRIQLNSGIPLFSTFVNIVRGGYGECSKICEAIIEEVQQGKKIDDVLDNAGMWSPSDYFRRMLWQIVNALKSGSDVSEALEAIARDIRVDKENKIKSYGKELNLYGLIYLMFAIIAPSMGVTLLVILSSFLGGDVANSQIFILILGVIVVFQVFFITFLKNKRPVI